MGDACSPIFLRDLSVLALETSEIQRQRADQALFDLAGVATRAALNEQGWEAATRTLADKDTKILEVETRRHDTEVGLAKVSEELRTALDRIARLDAEAERTRQEIDDAQSAMRQAVDARAAAEQETHQLRHRLEIAEAREAAGKEAQERLHQELREGRQELQANERIVCELRAELEAAGAVQRERDELLGQIAQLRSQNEALGVVAAETAQKDAEIAGLRQEVERAERELQEAVAARRQSERAVEAQRTLLPRYFSKRLTDEEGRLVRAIASSLQMHWRSKYEGRMLKRAEAIKELEEQKHRLEEANISLTTKLEAASLKLRELELEPCRCVAPQPTDRPADAAVCEAAVPRSRRRRGLLLLDHSSPIGSPTPDSDTNVRHDEPEEEARDAAASEGAGAGQEAEDGNGEAGREASSILQPADTDGSVEEDEPRTVQPTAASTASTRAPTAASQDGPSQDSATARKRGRQGAGRAATRPVERRPEVEQGPDGDRVPEVVVTPAAAATGHQRRTATSYDLRPFRR
ncbi:hypothetical protein ACQY0O_005309 [Thecaphora frezii]